jgi:hypothetical protein
VLTLDNTQLVEEVVVVMAKVCAADGAVVDVDVAHTTLVHGRSPLQHAGINIMKWPTCRKHNGLTMPTQEDK